MVFGENPTEDDGLAVPDQNLGVDLVLLDRRHIVEFVQVVGLILGHPNLHDHLVIGGDLRRHLQGQRGFLERDRGRPLGRGFLVRNLGALENPRSFLVGGDHLGLGDHFAIAAFFHGREFQVQQHVIGDKGDAQAGARADHAQVNER